MADVQDLLQQARGLGQALAAHPFVRSYYAAQQAVRTDPTAQQLLRDYQAHIDHLHELEARQAPIEPEDKQKLRGFEGQLASHDTLKQLLRTQTEYVNLMNQVNQAMEEPLQALVTTEKPA